MRLPPIIPGGSAPFASDPGSAGSGYREHKQRMRAEGDEHVFKTKAEKRAARALARSRERQRGGAAKSAAHEGVSENPLHALERKERVRKERLKTERGTSLARVKRHGNEEDEEGDAEFLEEIDLDKRAAEADLGIAPPLPRSILRPMKGIVKKR
jgi:hypothetical protein